MFSILQFIFKNFGAYLCYNHFFHFLAVIVTSSEKDILDSWGRRFSSTSKKKMTPRVFELVSRSVKQINRWLSINPVAVRTRITSILNSATPPICYHHIKIWIRKIIMCIYHVKIYLSNHPTCSLLPNVTQLCNNRHCYGIKRNTKSI